jgi:hypothetical protein
MDKIKRRLRDFDLGFKKDKTTPFIAIEGIVGGKQGHELGQWLAGTFNKNFDAYDSAVDSFYNQTHIGGSAYHHIVDGQHSVWGAFKSVQDVKVDDSWASELGQASEHLLRDVASVSGVNPFFVLSPEQFNNIASLVSNSNIGITREFLADALTINGQELFGGSIALIASIIMSRKADPSRLSYFSGGCLLSSLISLNPMMMPIAAGSMAYAIYKAENKKQMLLTAGKGSIVSGSALLVSNLVGGPAWIGCVAGFMTAVAIAKAIEKPDKAFEYTKRLLEPAKNIFKQVSYKLDAIKA